jgi:hypothetical protein
LAADTIVIEGSTVTQRAIVDGDGGMVYIYTGGSFPAGTHLATFKFLFNFTGPQGNTSGYITPLLFIRQQSGNAIIYTLIGIGKWSAVELNADPQTILFDIVEGVKVPPNADCTFGFINAVVNSSGTQLANSPGTVDMDESTDAGEGVGGAGTTNSWAATAQAPFAIPLGTSFGVSGSGADYSFYDDTRTYSAQAAGIVVTP